MWNTIIHSYLKFNDNLIKAPWKLLYASVITGNSLMWISLLIDVIDKWRYNSSGLLGKGPGLRFNKKNVILPV